MRRNTSRVNALTLVSMMVASSMTARAADSTLTLACRGTTTLTIEDAKPEPFSMSIIVNFTNRSVQGFGDPGTIDIPLKITGMNEVTISFGGGQPRLGNRLEHQRCH